MDKEHIINEVRRTAEENGGQPLGRQRFLKETGIRETDWVGIYWAKWNEVVEAAGYIPNDKQTAYDNQWIISQLIVLISELGRFPTTADMRLWKRSHPRFPSHSAIRRLGNKDQLAALVIQQCASDGNHSELLKICEPLAESPQAAQQQANRKIVDGNGFVYLVKLGKHYKIGRSICAEKRKYELQIQMPEKLALVHKITTDDPSGIEAYWHSRFADKRKNGEWFELTREDVTAFRRRKYM